jgi:hypothetical protein
VLHPPKTVNHYPAKSRITTLHMYFPHSHVLCTHTADLRSAVQAKGQTEAPAAGFRRTTDSALRTVRYAGPRIQHRLHDAHGSSSIGRKKKKKEGMHARVRHHHRSAVKRKREEVQFCLFMLRNCSHQFRPIPSPTHLPLLASPVTSGEIYSHQPPANTTNASTKCHRLKSARSVS